MVSNIRSLGLSIVLCVAGYASVPPGLRGAQVAVVTKDSSGYHFAVAEGFTINGKPRVRLRAAEATPAEKGASVRAAPAPLQPKEADRLPQTLLAQSVLLRKSDDGLLYSYEAASNKWSPVVPEGVSVKAPETLVAIWGRAQLAYLADRKSKNATPVPYEQFFAMAVGDTASAAFSEMAVDPLRWNVPGTVPEARLYARLELLGAFVKSYPNDGKSVQNYLAKVLKNFTNGAQNGSYAALSNAERWIATSESAFPGDAEQKGLRDALRQNKLDVDHRAAVLSALAAGELWDPFLAQYRQLEPYEAGWKTLVTVKLKALEQSAVEHRVQGDRLADAHDYSGAAAQYKLALKRNPTDAGALKGLEAVRLQGSRQSALKRAASLPTRDPHSPMQVQVQRHLDLAQRYIADGKSPEAEAELKTAAQVDPAAPSIALAQARLLASQGELKSALTTLDRYDALAATDDEFAAGEKLRTELLYNLKKFKEATLSQVQRHFSGDAFARTLEAATSGLAVDPEDVDLLFYAGQSAGILRRTDEARKLLSHYLELSDTLGSDSQKRARSRFMLRQLAKTTPVEDGKPHWFSGFKVKENVFYCPESLVFGPRVAAIKSNKLNVAFDWNGAQLKSVHSLWENKHTGMNTFSAIMGGIAAAGGQVATVNNIGAERDRRDFYFDYYNDFPQVLRISNERTTSKDGDTVSQVYTQSSGSNGSFKTTQMNTVKEDEGSSNSAGKWSFVTLFNNPKVDPIFAAYATGHRIAQGFAPNLYFNPFAWDEVYLFELVYDDSGRVMYAWCKNPPKAELRQARYEFEWNGFRLQRIVQRSTSQPDSPVLYERTMNYSGEKLMSENISFGGRQSKIVYKYEGNRLVEAHCYEDPSLENRSRNATFVD